MTFRRHPSLGSRHSSVTTYLTQYHIANGFGDKSTAWWPSGPLHDKSILRQEVSEEQRYSYGPFLGRVSFQIKVSDDIKDWCALTPVRLALT
jgi:hypothetical protein